MFAKGYTQNCSEEIYVIKQLSNYGSIPEYKIIPGPRLILTGFIIWFDNPLGFHSKNVETLVVVLKHSGISWNIKYFFKFFSRTSLY